MEAYVGRNDEGGLVKIFFLIFSKSKVLNYFMYIKPYEMCPPSLDMANHPNFARTYINL